MRKSRPRFFQKSRWSFSSLVFLLSTIILGCMLIAKMRSLEVANQGLNLTQRRLDRLQNYADYLSELNTNDSRALTEILSQLHNLSELYYQSTHGELALPSTADFLPHLRNTTMYALRPCFQVVGPNRRSDVFTVIGIPTVQRQKASYLMATLRSLIDNLSAEDKNEILFVLMIADRNGTESSFVHEQSDAIRNEFQNAIDSGLLEVIVPPPFWYPPDLSELPSPLKEKPERMYWRTKQTFDYIYLMMYCQKRGRYYMQLEDDIVTTVGYVDRMRQFIAHNAQTPWLMLELSSLGFIGKLFHSTDLPLIINFLIMFHRERPVDWLLDVIFDVRYCYQGQKHDLCRKAVLQHRILMQPPLFQHVGLQSSLAGKIQKLKEYRFNSSSNLFISHRDNPTATLKTSLRAYKNYTLENAYRGDTFFWALLPQPGDFIQFDFDPPFRINAVRFRSGNSEFPLDKFYNATVEFLYASTSQVASNSYIRVMALNPDGQFRISNRTRQLDVASLRIINHVESEHWLILNEIWIR